MRKRSPGFVNHHALVHQDVFLKRAFEIVAEGGGRAGGGQVAVVGLHQAPLANLVLLDLVADRDDPADDLVARHRGLAPGNVVGHLLQGLGTQPLDDLALAGMLVELLQQLEIGEAKAHAFDLGENLVRARVGGLPWRD